MNFFSLHTLQSIAFILVMVFSNYFIFKDVQHTTKGMKNYRTLRWQMFILVLLLNVHALVVLIRDYIPNFIGSFNNMPIIVSNTIIAIILGWRIVYIKKQNKKVIN